MSATPLAAFALFHLNLCFSSIEEEARDTVIARCYWPLLRLPARTGAPVAIEASAWTLEEIARRDLDWIAALRAAVADRTVEFVGSGYAQMIGPLVPETVTRANLAHGLAVYAALLDVRPRLALVNEQAYSAGLVPLYRDAGFAAILMDWDNCAGFHPDWSPDWRYYPQAATGPDGTTIPVLWTNTIAFQKLQRLAHGDITEDEYAAYVAGQRGSSPRALALYGNDAECFDYRPGRFATEERLHAPVEWSRIASAMRRVAADGSVTWCRPSDALALEAPGLSGRRLALERPENPVPVKKQPKYNVTRWAATGRDDLGINTLCWRAWAGLTTRGLPPEHDDWRTLCALWASDYRTHITERRWQAYLHDLHAFVARVEAKPAATQIDAPLESNAAPPCLRAGRWLDLETAQTRVTLDARRGLAVDRLGFAPGFVPLAGSLRHGHFDAIALSADWYTGNAVFEAPGRPKLTDLERVTPHLAREVASGDLIATAELATPLGPISKSLRVHAARPRLDLAFHFAWPDRPAGVLRLGHLTLLSDVFEADSLVCRTHNGGVLETFRLAGHTIDHGAAVSWLVSATSALGLTDGWAELADRRHGVRVTVDKTAAALIGLLTHRRAGDRLFCQLVLSAREHDDTTRPEPRPVPLDVRLALTPAGVAA